MATAVKAGSLLVHDATLLDAHGRVPDAWLRTEGDRIAARGTGDGWRAHVDVAQTVVDAAGATLTPGFIDIHQHGGDGGSYDSDARARALAFHRSHGTTRTLLSLVTAPLHDLEHALGAIARLARTDPLVLGSHLEGPFLATGRRGAHDPAELTSPTPEAIERLLAAADGTLRMVTLAPELPGAEIAQRRLREAGVLVAIGHTEADYDLARSAFDRGARVLTHAFNAMPAIDHRAPGPVIAAADHESAVLELILDGVHVHPAVAAALFRLAPGRVALITDAMAAAGAPDGDYRLGGMQVQVAGGIARLAETGSLAGSTLTQDVALRHAVCEARIAPAEAVRALTLTPARLLGIDDLGLLKPGNRADLVLLDEDWRVKLVVADGAIQPASVGEESV
ncbi:MAG: N-acetylglucosamine-6-phosphate deacetylase [Microbacterium sp.]